MVFYVVSFYLDPSQNAQNEAGRSKPSFRRTLYGHHIISPVYIAIYLEEWNMRRDK